MERMARTPPAVFMSRIGRTCRQPTEACAYQVPRVLCLAKMRGDGVGVVGEMFERDGAILDEGDGFGVAFHGHHDVEAGFADVPDLALGWRVADGDDGVGEAVIGHGLVETAEVAVEGVAGVAGEFDDEEAVGSAARDLAECGAKERDIGAEDEDVVVDEFDGGGGEGDEVACRLHGGAEARELTDADDAMSGEARELRA